MVYIAIVDFRSTYFLRWKRNSENELTRLFPQSTSTAIRLSERCLQVILMANRKLVCKVVNKLIDTVSKIKRGKI
jgi:hypothetical protein